MKKLLPTILFLLLTLPLSATDFSRLHLGMPQRISDNYIMGIAQDRKGYIWVSTESGLNRFDGTAFRSFRKSNSDIGADALNRLFADPDENTLWIATQRNGLDRLDLDTYSYTHFRHDNEDAASIASDGVTSVAAARDGGLWISTYTDGLDYFDKKTGKFTHYNSRTVDDWPGDRLWRVTSDTRGNVYLAHADKGFTIFNPESGKLHNFRHNPSDPASLPSDRVSTVFIDSNHNIWVGTDKGLALLSPLEGTFITFRHSSSNHKSLPSDNIRDISQTADGRLLVATENGGLSILDPEAEIPDTLSDLEFENYTSAPDSPIRLSNKTVQSVFFDTFGNIWAGTYGDGIDVLSTNRSSFRNRDKHAGQEENPVVPIMAICAYSDSIWAGTDGRGADLYGPEGKIATFSDLGDNAVLAIHRDKVGNVWFGTYGGQIFRLKPGEKNVRKVADKGLDDIRCFTDTPAGELLIGHGTGVSKIDSAGNLIHFEACDSVTGEELVRSLMFDNTGRLFVGSFGNGTAVYSPDGNFLKRFTIWSGLPSNNVNHIISDNNGNTLVATAEGLARIKPDLSIDTVFGLAEGLEDEYVTALTMDRNDNIWMSTHSGISVLSPKGEIDNYRSSFSSTLNDFSRGAVGQTSDGNIYFGSHYGISSFTPDKLDKTVFVPAPVFTSVTVFSSLSDTERIEYVLDKGVKVPYNQNTIRVLFGILDPFEAGSVDYRYRITGQGNRWYPCTNGNSLILSNLPAGNYRLALQAVSHEGGAVSEISYLDITVTPPMWATWWAKLCYIILAIALLLYLVHIYKKRMKLEYDLSLERRNIRHEQELNAERLRFFTNITHELRTPLTLILGPLEDLKKDNSLPEKFSRRIAAIHRSAARLLDLINTILEFRKTETQNRNLRVLYGDMAKLVEDIGSRYKELNTKPDLTIETEIDPGDFHLWFDPEIVAMIVDNLMSNACKYTNAGKVTLSLYHSEESSVPFTEIAVTDTGVGMNEDTLKHIFDRYYRDRTTAETRLGTGIGLALVYNLIELHEGEIFVDSEFNRGSVFRFRLHTDNSYPYAERRDTPALSDENESLQLPESEQNNDQTDMPSVLVVEDNMDIIDYIRDTLGSEYIVYAASNGADGLKAARKQCPDIILTDLMMPFMDGISMIKKLKSDQETEHIPIIIVTAKTADEARQEAYEAGADSYITKPFSSSLIKSRINNILNTRHSLALTSIGRTADGSRPHVVVRQEPDDNVDILSKLPEADAEFIGKVSKIIKENISSDTLDVSFIADKMFMSHSTLYRKIKSITGLTIARLIRKERARMAADLLMTGKYTVSEISLMVGMGSQANFRQCFKEEYGVTPSEYRKS